MFKLGLCDETDPDVEDMEDVIGLCSGQFVTQPNEGSSQSQAAASQASTVQFLRPVFPDPYSTAFWIPIQILRIWIQVLQKH